MSWVLLTLLAAFMWSIINLLDKHVISKEMKDPLMATVVYGFTLFLLSFISFFFRKISLSKNVVFVSIIIGAFCTIAVWFYYRAIAKEEVSRFVPMLVSFSPLFVLIIAFFFLGERFTAIKYVGIFLVLVGAVLISLKKDSHKLFLSRALFITLLAGFFFALRDISVKYITLQISLFSILFWIGLGAGLVAIVIVSLHHPHLRKKAKKGIWYLIGINLLSALAFFVYSLAISKGPVSLVAALLQFVPFFVFVGTILLSLFLPKFLKEKMDRKTLIQKIIAIIIIVIGAILII